MKTLKGILWLLPLGVLLLLLLGCRPVAQADKPVRAIEETVPAQATTPTPTPTPTATPVKTVTPGNIPPPVPTVIPSATPTRTVAPLATLSPTPRPTSGPEPRPTYPPNRDLSVPPPPSPPPKRSPLPQPRTKEEAVAQINQLRKEEGMKPGILQKTEGPTTAGATIAIARKAIKLPGDAYIDSKIIGISCGPGPCPKPPVYTIARGKSRITFSGADGFVVSEQIAPGEEYAFDFLRSYLKK